MTDAVAVAADVVLFKPLIGTRVNRSRQRYLRVKVSKTATWGTSVPRICSIASMPRFRAEPEQPSRRSLISPLGSPAYWIDTPDPHALLDDRQHQFPAVAPAPESTTQRVRSICKVKSSREAEGSWSSRTTLSSFDLQFCRPAGASSRFALTREVQEVGQVMHHLSARIGSF